MPYTRNSELPKGVRDALPGEAQTVFREVVNSQLARGLSEDRAFASAWAAVKRGWKKVNGEWVKKMAESTLFNRECKIEKIDEDQNLVFGWAYVAEDRDGNVAFDHSGEFVTDIKGLEKAQYEFVLTKRVAGEMHQEEVGRLVESFVSTREKQKAMGLPEGALPVGIWFGAKVSPEVFAKVKDGTYKAFSIGGRARRLTSD